MRIIEFFKRIFRKDTLCKPQPYEEKDTKCDKCENLSECMKRGNVIDCTLSFDTRKHYIVGIGCYCLKRDEEIEKSVQSCYSE